MEENIPDSVIEKMCEDKGLKMTEQRRIVARVLSLAEDHPDVEEVYKRCSEIDERISIATVYRTVKLFEAEGLVHKHDFGDSKARYEISSSCHHDHLIDVNTGEVIEFNNETLEELQKVIADSLGYELVGHRMELYGVLKETKKK